MIVLGLTGSIGMGKSTAANMLLRLGVPVSDADAIVHELIGPDGGAVMAVEAAFPGSVENGAVDRAALGARVFGDAAALKRLEAILHPLVGRARDRFLKQAARAGKSVVALDIPLLFETGGDRLCDATIVVVAPHLVQASRVLARPGMTAAKLADIRRRQMPDAQKRRRADFIVPSGLGRHTTLRSLAHIVRLAKAGRLPRRRRKHPGHARNRP